MDGNGSGFAYLFLVSWFVGSFVWTSKQNAAKGPNDTIDEWCGSYRKYNLYIIGILYGYAIWSGRHPEGISGRRADRKYSCYPVQTYKLKHQ